MFIVDLPYSLLLEVQWNLCLFKIIFKVMIMHWQAVPEVCLWQLNNAEQTNFYLHCSSWIVLLMIVLAIDITEITGL